MGTLLNRRRYMGGGGESQDLRFIATYNVIDDSTTTKVLYSTSGITSIEIDGVSQTVATSYQLPLGDHEVKIGVSDTSKVYNTMFSGIGRLTQIILPLTITTIGNNAFQNCKALTSFIIYAVSPPTLGTNVFRYVSPMPYIYVPSESVDTYKAASGWSSLASKIQAIPTT